MQGFEPDDSGVEGGGWRGGKGEWVEDGNEWRLGEGKSSRSDMAA